MTIEGRKVAIVGMGGAFPDCKDLSDFKQKLFKGDSLIRSWDEATVHEKNIRSTVSGYITDAEMGLEPIYSTILPGYLETYIDLLGRIPDSNLSTSDMGSIWSMIATQDSIKMAGWTEAETQSGSHHQIT